MHKDGPQLPDVGDVLKGVYRLEGQIGRGAFGVVYRAIHLDLEEPVAIKIIRPSLLTDRKLLKRFRREIRVAKALKHPNTVRIYDASATPDGIPYYVMELLDGICLSELIDDELSLSPERTGKILVQILKALSEAHATGAVHRDLKPDNVMVCDVHGESDFVKLLDFGIASMLDTQEHLTLGHTIVGTPSYMSPEQALGLQVDARSDVYSVGLIGVECLTGEPIVTSTSLIGMLSRQASDTEVPLPSAINLSPLGQVLRRATLKKPADRFESAAAMIEALRALEPLSDVPLPSNWGAANPEDETASEAKGSAELGLTVEVDPWTNADPIGVDVGNGAKKEAVIAFDDTQEHRSDPAIVMSRGAASSKRRTLLLALLLVAVATGALLVGRASRDAVPIEQASAATLGTGEADWVEADAGPEKPVIAAQVEPDVVEAPPPAHTATSMAAFQIAQDRVDASLPATHEVEFAGLEGVSVRLGDGQLGVTPFRGIVPRGAEAIPLSLEREGYVSAIQLVSLDEPTVLIDLVADVEDEPRSERGGRDGDSRGRDDETDVRPPEGLFGSAPVDDFD